MSDVELENKTKRNKTIEDIVAKACGISYALFLLGSSLLLLLTIIGLDNKGAFDTIFIVTLLFLISITIVSYVLNKLNSRYIKTITKK